MDDLIWLDTATKTKAAADAIGSGAMAPNEARKKYYGLGPVKGGDTPYMQQQNYSLSALAERDNDDPFAKPTPAPAAPPPAELPPAPVDDDEPDDDEPAPAAKSAVYGALALALLRKDWSGLTDAP